MYKCVTHNFLKKLINYNLLKNDKTSYVKFIFCTQHKLPKHQSGSSGARVGSSSEYL